MGDYKAKMAEMEKAITRQKAQHPEKEKPQAQTREPVKNTRKRGPVAQVLFRTPEKRDNPVQEDRSLEIVPGPAVDETHF